MKSAPLSLAAVLLCSLLTACISESTPLAGSTPPPGEDLAPPLAQAHAHNDYEHARPLLDALDEGFMSVEADVWVAPLGDSLYVSHNVLDIRADRELRALYLDPLLERFERYGAIYPGQQRPFQLLVDFKTAADSTWAALEATLADYAPMLSVFDQGVVTPGAVEVVISGNRPTATLVAATRRLAFIDGRLSDFDAPPPSTLVPLISDNWSNQFSWRGEGAMSTEESTRLDEIMTMARAGGYRIRFWETPDEAGGARTALWTRLYDAGVDHLNSDDLAGLAAFLREREDRQ
ncbi:MAG: phosphatidylinositol-specific phospholipase C/glycerophosphodiester phosphodiesterase family protein [Pseudomonadota bacterium]|nr:phosphatidylinositol-specific phospholipase C/glycerophosphodiester phosphodiesterase family protein [Pseudomonadota bacterium]